MGQGDLFFVPPERRAAAEAAAAHADREAADYWSAEALGFLYAFAAAPARTGPWLAEDVIRHATERGLAEPPDRRAWGAVVATAARRKLIVRAGFRTDAYGSPKSLWRIAP